MFRLMDFDGWDLDKFPNHLNISIAVCLSGYKRIPH